MNDRFTRAIASIALCSAAVVSLQGCLGLAVGSAVVGTMAAVDRRTVGAQTEDKAIVLKGENRLGKLGGEAGHINVTSYNRKVLLTGEVKDEEMKQAAEREAAAIEGVTGVTNELEIGGISSMTSRSNDALITTKVKASLVDNKQVSANSFKVVTERGVVYLMGLVTPHEGDIAAEVVRGVGGVHKVVKVLDYISEEELQRIKNQ